MIEIILLIFLSQRIGNIARNKGLTVWKWRLAAILAWVGLEIPAALISFGYTQNFFVASISGFLAGFLGYFMVKSKLDKTMPINNGGV